MGGLGRLMWVGLEDFLFIHLKSPWTAFHGSAVLRGIYKKTHPAQWVGLEDGAAAVGGLGRWGSLYFILRKIPQSSFYFQHHYATY